MVWGTVPIFQEPPHIQNQVPCTVVNLIINQPPFLQFCNLGISKKYPKTGCKMGFILLSRYLDPQGISSLELNIYIYTYTLINWNYQLYESQWTTYRPPHTLICWLKNASTCWVPSIPIQSCIDCRLIAIIPLSSSVMFPRLS